MQSQVILIELHSQHSYDYSDAMDLVSFLVHKGLSASMDIGHMNIALDGAGQSFRIMVLQEELDKAKDLLKLYLSGEA